MRPARLPLVIFCIFVMLPAFRDLSGQQQSYSSYKPNTVRPVTTAGSAQQYDSVTHKPCGGPQMPLCTVQVKIAPKASAEDVFKLAVQANNKKEYAVALAYVKKSAAMGNVKAESALGNDYLHGLGVVKDINQAVHWLDLAARQGDYGAELVLGEYYENGEYTTPQESKAIEYYKQSAAQKYAPAELNLGLDYEFGRGVPRSREKAIALLNRAAAHGKNPVAGKYARALSHAPASRHFNSEPDLMAYLQPPARAVQRAAPAQTAGNTGDCPDLLPAANVSVYFANHPNCNRVHKLGFDPGEPGFDWVRNADGSASMVR